MKEIYKKEVTEQEWNEALSKLKKGDSAMRPSGGGFWQITKKTKTYIYLAGYRGSDKYWLDEINAIKIKD